jgi:hypothetical protein
VVHVKQEANEAAHGLAKIAAPKKTDKVWVEDIPNSIFSTFFYYNLRAFSSFCLESCTLDFSMK